MNALANFEQNLSLALNNIFNVNINDLNNLLIKHSGMIAGGLTSCIYSNNGDSSHYSGDIDIWIANNDINQIKTDFSKLLINSSNYMIINEFDFANRILLKSNKCPIKTSYTNIKTSYTNIKTSYTNIKTSYTNIKNKNIGKRSNLSNITHMLKLKHCVTQKEIQLIFVNVTLPEVLQHFDFSFCSVGYDGLNVYCIEPELTLYKIGYIMNDHGEDSIIRSNKYKKRGYQLFDSKIKAMTYLQTLQKV
jgi:hypothetical protein